LRNCLEAENNCEVKEIALPHSDFLLVRTEARGLGTEEVCSGFEVMKAEDPAGLSSHRKLGLAGKTHRRTRY
jgi:hypothetical protein